MMRVEVTPNLLTVGVRLRAADRALANQLRRDLRAVVQPIAEEAKVRAATFSTTIPQSIAVRTSFTRRTTTVRIVEQASKLAPGHAPLARIQEFGSSRNAGKIRHPTFGHEPVVDQQAHPYLRALCRERAPEVQAALMAALADVAEVAGFRVT